MNMVVHKHNKIIPYYTRINTMCLISVWLLTDMQKVKVRDVIPGRKTSANMNPVAVQLSTLCTTVCLEKTLKAIYLWKDSHLTPSQSTTPDVISSSAKYSVSMPSSSCFLNWIPEVVKSSMESCAYISSLMKTNTCHTVIISTTKDNWASMRALTARHYYKNSLHFISCDSGAVLCQCVQFKDF